jgi:hypothetical protein
VHIHVVNVTFIFLYTKLLAIQWAKPSEAKQNRTKPSQANPSKAKKAKQSKAEQNKAKQSQVSIQFQFQSRLSTIEFQLVTYL